MIYSLLNDYAREIAQMIRDDMRAIFLPSADLAQEWRQLRHRDVAAGSPPLPSRMSTMPVYDAPVDRTEAMPDDALLPLEQFNAKIDAVLADVAQWQQQCNALLPRDEERR